MTDGAKGNYDTTWKRNNLVVSYQNDEIASSRRLLAMTRNVSGLCESVKVANTKAARGL